MKILKQEFFLQNMVDHEDEVEVLRFWKLNETTRVSHSSISSYLPTRMCIFPHKRSLSPVIYFYLVHGKLTLLSFIPRRFTYVSARHPVVSYRSWNPPCREDLSEFLETRSCPGGAISSRRRWDCKFPAVHSKRNDLDRFVGS